MEKFDRKYWEDKLSKKDNEKPKTNKKHFNSFEELAEEINGGSKKDHKEEWLDRTLESLIRLGLEIDDGKYPGKDIGFIKCKRLINIRRSLPVDILRISYPNLILFSGINIPVEGYLLTRDFVDKHVKYLGSRKTNNTKVYDFSDIVELNDDLNMSTFNFAYDGKYYFIISKSEPISEYFISNKYDVYDFD